MIRIFSLLLIVLILAFGLFFGLLNAENVEVDYYLGKTEMPLSVVMVVMLVAGAVLGTVASLGVVVRLRRRVARLRRELRKAGLESPTQTT